MTAELDSDGGIELWSSQAWRDLVVGWLDEQLAVAGVERTGDVQQPHLRPWATALTAPTTAGPVWLKAAGPGTAFEVGLYELLHRAAPDDVLSPMATDVARGWIVLPDGGSPLGELVAGGDLVDALKIVLPRYAKLQRNVAAHVDEVLALGASDMRPAIMPRRFVEALAAVHSYVERRGDDADRATYERLAGLGDTYAAWCERLERAPGPASLDHNDLYPWNMLVADGHGPGDVRFYDWGDSVVAHPFACMLVPLGWVNEQLGFDAGSAELLGVRDAYLEVFRDLAPHAELVETLELACHVAKAARALTWTRALQALSDEDAGRFADAPLKSMRALLDAFYLGGA